MTEHIKIGDMSPCSQLRGDGTQIVFTYRFPIFKDADIRVYINGTHQQTGYTVAGAGQSEGGTVTFDTPPEDGAIITLLRHLDIARITDFQNTGDLRAKVLNDQLDYLITAIQQVNERVDRCLLRPFTSMSAADLSLPEPEPGKVLGWNVNANALENKSLELIGVTNAVLAAAEELRQEVKQNLEHVQAHASTAQTAARQMAEQIGSATWPLITGKPDTFPPAEHTHPIQQVTGITISPSAPTPADGEDGDVWFQI